MVRKLPWLIEQKSSKSKPAAVPRSQKRQRLLDARSDDASSPASSPRAGLTAQQKRAERTPSTSPPPEPPTEEFMREGLHADDIYMMVEDEFCATAKLFTQHLHYTEYRRLKEEARKRNPSTIANISRPVDNRSTMSNDTRLKKEREARQKKQKAVLGSESEETQSETEKVIHRKKDEDPWIGTSLQNLMSPSHKRPKSLMGLQNLQSSTKAAKGYAPPKIGTSSLSTNFGRKPVVSIAASKKPTKRSVIPIDNSNSGSETESEDDDLDAPAHRKDEFSKSRVNKGPRVKEEPKPSFGMTFVKEHPLKEMKRREDREHLPRPILKRQKPPDFVDEFPQARPLIGGRRRAVGSQKIKEEQDVEEIPVFIA